MTTHKTLVLNKDYTVIHVCTWQNAISLVHIKEVAHEIDFYKDRQIKSVRRNYTIPAVIVLKKFVKHNYTKKKFSRAGVYQRDNYTCQYCNNKFPASQLTLDHVHAKKHYKNKEDSTNYLNITTACKRCNSKKADRSCEETNMYPRTKPYAPSYIDIVLAGVNKIPKEWIPYVKGVHVSKEKTSYSAETTL